LLVKTPGSFLNLDFLEGMRKVGAATEVTSHKFMVENSCRKRVRAGSVQLLGNKLMAPAHGDRSVWRGAKPG
jgi:hypothetical protein